MTSDSTQTLPLGTLVRGEKFTRKFRLTDVPITVTPTWHWTRKKHQGEVTLAKSGDTTWDIHVCIDSVVFEDDGDYSQNLVITLGEDDKRKINVTFAIARQSQAAQVPLIIDNAPIARQSPHMVTRRRFIFTTRFEIYTMIFVAFILVTSRLIGSSMSDSTSLFFSNFETAAADVGLHMISLIRPTEGEQTPEVGTATVDPTVMPAIAATQTTEPTAVPNTATPEVILAQSSCPELRTTRLSIGMTGSVVIQSTSALRLRSDPSIYGSTLYGMTFGTGFIVQDGPICADGYRWWQIQLTETQTQGWAAENDAANYFLAPS